MRLTNQEIIEARTSLLAFSKIMMKAVKGIDFIENWHHKEICTALEKVVVGYTKRLIINIPPRYSKTELAVVNFIAWTLGNFPDSEYLHCAYGAHLAVGNTGRVKNMIENEVYSQIFPDFKLKVDEKAKGLFSTDEGGQVFADGTAGALTGKGAGKLTKDGIFHGAIIIDDPIKPNDSKSEAIRPQINEWFSETLESRLNSPETPIIVIMQRLHQEDLSGFLLDGGNGEEWEHLLIPVWDDNEKPLWEFKHDHESLKRLQATNPYVFAGQMEQRPSPKGGGLFKDEWWRYYDETSLPTIISKRIYADTALKTKEKNDFSVLQCWGKSATGQIYLLDQLRGKWEAPELEINARAFYNKHNQGYTVVNAFKIEDKASGIGLIQSLKREGIPIVPIPRTIDKVTRANDTTGLLQSGNVFLNKNWDGLSDYLYEFSTFPNAKHDDQVDPTMDAISDLLRNEIINYGELI